MNISEGVYLIKRREEKSEREPLNITEARRFELQWLAFTKNFYAPYTNKRKVTYFFPVSCLPKTCNNFANSIVVPENYPEGTIPRRVKRYNHYNLLVQFYEKTKDNRVLDTIQKWKPFLFGRLPPIPKPRISSLIQYFLDDLFGDAAYPPLEMLEQTRR